MKKTFWSLAALMFMAALLMTSCNKNLDEAQTEQVDGNTVTLTIAVPVYEAETRVAVDGTSLKITGWELNDEVILYKASISSGSEMMPAGYSSSISGDGVTFACIDATNGTFSGTLPDGKTLEDYNFAVFGASAVSRSTSGPTQIHLIPTTKCSAALKSVVMMAALKSGDSYTMQVVNAVMKVNNNTGAAMEVAWSGKTGGGQGPYFFNPQIRYEQGKWMGIDVNNGGWTDSHFRLASGDCYINMGLMGHPYDSWGIAKEDGTQVIERKSVGDRSYYGAIGKLYNAGTIN